MADATLEQRVAALETAVAELRAPTVRLPGVKNWRRTIGMFGDDPDMKRIFDAALKYREEDRKRARKKQTRRAAK